MTKLFVDYNPSHFEGDAEDKVYYAKIARTTNVMGQAAGLPFIIFDKTQDAQAVTEYRSAMRFNVGREAEYELEVGTSVNEEEYLQLATAIVDSLTMQVSPEVAKKFAGRREKLTAAIGHISSRIGDAKANFAERGKELTDHESWIADVDTEERRKLSRNQLRRRRIGVGIAASMLWWHVPFFGSDVDIGPVPMPQPRRSPKRASQFAPTPVRRRRVFSPPRPHDCGNSSPLRWHR